MVRNAIAPRAAHPAAAATASVAATTVQRGCLAEARVAEQRLAGANGADNSDETAARYDETEVAECKVASRVRRRCSRFDTVRITPRNRLSIDTQHRTVQQDCLAALSTTLT